MVGTRAGNNMKWVPAIAKVNTLVPVKSEGMPLVRALDNDYGMDPWAIKKFWKNIHKRKFLALTQ